MTTGRPARGGSHPKPQQSVGICPAGTAAFIPKLIILAGIGLATDAAGVVVFNQRDLPL